MTIARRLLAAVAVLALVAIAVEGFYLVRENRRQTCIAKQSAFYTAAGVAYAPSDYSSKGAKVLVAGADKDLDKCVKA